MLILLRNRGSEDRLWSWSKCSDQQPRNLIYVEFKCLIDGTGIVCRIALQHQPAHLPPPALIAPDAITNCICGGQGLQKFVPTCIRIWRLPAVIFVTRNTSFVPFAGMWQWVLYLCLCIAADDSGVVFFLLDQNTRYGGVYRETN